MENDQDIPFDLNAEIIDRRWPQVTVDQERFQPRIRVQHVGKWTEIYARFVDMRTVQALHQWRENNMPKGVRSESKAKDPDDVKRASTQRRKRRIRLHCLERSVDHMWTFTMRFVEKAEEKTVIVKAFEGFQKTIRKRAPKFDPVWTLERQENGQWHIHAAIRGFYDVKWFRAAWYDCLNTALGRSLDNTRGSDTPGQVDVTYKPGPGGSKKRASIKIAGYIAKYVAKNTDEIGFNKKGYHHGRGVKVLSPVSYYYKPLDSLAATLQEFIKDFHLERAMCDKDTDFLPMDSMGSAFFIRVPRVLYDPPPM
jgi:hypothetical protein